MTQTEKDEIRQIFKEELAFALTIWRPVIQYVPQQYPIPTFPASPAYPLVDYSVGVNPYQNAKQNPSTAP